MQCLDQIELENGFLCKEYEQQREIDENPFPGHLMVHIVKNYLLEETIDLVISEEYSETRGEVPFGGGKKHRD
jgi:hypothetical protein